MPGSHCLRTLLPAELDTDAEVQVWDPDQMAAPHLAPHKTVAPLRQGTITMVHYDLVQGRTAAASGQGCLEVLSGPGEGRKGPEHTVARDRDR